MNVSVLLSKAGYLTVVSQNGCQLKIQVRHPDIPLIFSQLFLLSRLNNLVDFKSDENFMVGHELLYLQVCNIYVFFIFLTFFS